MPTIDDISDEILDEICEHNRGDTRSLMSAARVCRRRRRPAQRALFRHLEFRDSERPAKWLASPARISGITALGFKPQVFDFLLTPSLADLKYLSLVYPEEVSPKASSPNPPFRLSHLDIALDANGTGVIVSQLLEGSSKYLITLSIHGFVRSLSTVAETLSTLARIPLPNLRHLILDYIENIPAVVQLISLLPSLQSLSLLNFHEESITAVLPDLSPSLTTLRLHGGDKFPQNLSLALDGLRLTLAKSEAGSLRNLHLPVPVSTTRSGASLRSAPQPTAPSPPRLLQFTRRPVTPPIMSTLFFTPDSPLPPRMSSIPPSHPNPTTPPQLPVGSPPPTARTNPSTHPTSTRPSPPASPSLTFLPTISSSSPASTSTSSSPPHSNFAFVPTGPGSVVPLDPPSPATKEKYAALFRALLLRANEKGIGAAEVRGWGKGVREKLSGGRTKFIILNWCYGVRSFGATLEKCVEEAEGEVARGETTFEREDDHGILVEAAMRLGRKVDERLRRTPDGRGKVPDTLLGSGEEFPFDDPTKPHFVFYPVAEWDRDGRKEDRDDRSKSRDQLEKERIVRLGLDAGSGSLSKLYWTELPLFAEWEIKTYEGIEIVEVL